MIRISANSTTVAAAGAMGPVVCDNAADEGIMPSGQITDSD
jgi:hypothetical protein